MGEVPLSLHVTAEIKKELEKEARLLNVSESEIAERAIASYLEVGGSGRELLKQRLAEAHKGAFISSEAMNRWSWNSDLELSPPKPDVFIPAGSFQPVVDENRPSGFDDAGPGLVSGLLPVGIARGRSSGPCEIPPGNRQPCRESLHRPIDRSGRFEKASRFSTA